LGQNPSCFPTNGEEGVSLVLPARMACSTLHWKQNPGIVFVFQLDPLDERACSNKAERSVSELHSYQSKFQLIEWFILLIMKATLFSDPHQVHPTK